MLISVAQPTNEQLAALATAERHDALTYAPVGLTADKIAPAGYRLDRWVRDLGCGERIFTAAAEVINSWKMH